MEQKMQPGEMAPEETTPEELTQENTPEASQDGAYWWFVNLYDPTIARPHVDEIKEFSPKDYDAFVGELNDRDRENLQRIKDSGLKNSDDKQLIELLSQGFSEYVKKLDKGS